MQVLQQLNSNSIMTADITPLLLQLLLKENPLVSLLSQQNNQNSLFQSSQQLMNQQLNMMIHSQLMQTILQERLKNEILMKALLMNSKGLQQKNSQMQQKPEIQSNFKSNPGYQNIPKIQAISDDYYSKSNRKSKSEHISTQLLEEKKIGVGSFKRVKNQTKNIPKNYGKAIISFIEKNDQLVKRILSRYENCQYATFMMNIRQKKKKLNSIADLRSLWLEEENSFAKPTRILSLIFLKKHSLGYIFNSRVTNFKGHIKYRYRLIEALQNPEKFTSIKVF